MSIEHKLVKSKQKWREGVKGAFHFFARRGKIAQRPGRKEITGPGGLNEQKESIPILWE
jgi:hypothetical protein